MHENNRYKTLKIEMPEKKFAVQRKTFSELIKVQISKFKSLTSFLKCVKLHLFERNWCELRVRIKEMHM